MSELDRELISRAMLDGDIKLAKEHRISAKHIASDEALTIWKWMGEYWLDHQKVPNQRMFERNWPTYELYDDPEPMSAIITELNLRRRKSLLHHHFAEALRIRGDEDIEDPDAEIIALMQRTLTDINTETVTSRDVDLTQNFVERLHQYHRWIESGGALHGIPSGFVGLDNLLHGWQPEQLITLVGRAKAGKSTILMTFAAAAQSSGVPVLFVSFEMSNDEQQSRYDSIISHLSHDKIRTGRLNKQQMADLYKTAKQWANYPSFILSNDITANMTVSGIAAKAAEYNPGLIIVDGVYLMEDESGERRGSPQAITNITRALKRLAQTRRTPVLCTTQVLDWKLGHGKGKKVGKITQGSIGYSSSFAQDSDALLAVEREEGTDIAYISIVIARNAPSDRRVAIEFDWDNGSFEEIDAETEQSATEDPLPARPAAARRDPDTWE